MTSIQRAQPFLLILAAGLVLLTVAWHPAQLVQAKDGAQCGEVIDYCNGNASCLAPVAFRVVACNDPACNDGPCDTSNTVPQDNEPICDSSPKTCDLIQEDEQCFYDSTVCDGDVCSAGALIPVQCNSRLCSEGPCMHPLASQKFTDESVENTNGNGNDRSSNTGIASISPPLVLTVRRGPNAIPNRLVPITVDRLFGEVFGRHITPRESIYWKNRARTDKPTEQLLQDAMQWHNLHR